MEDAIAGGRAARNALERLGARVPGFAGYLERELRREADQRLRAELALRIDGARDAVLARLGRLELRAPAIGRLSAVERSLDAAANRLRHAGSGYAGMFDIVKIAAAQLEALYRYDEALAGAVDEVRSASGRLAEGDSALAALEAAVTALEQRVAGRDEAVRSALAGRT